MMEVAEEFGVMAKNEFANKRRLFLKLRLSQEVGSGQLRGEQLQ
jgi:hypothetical protein